MSKVSYLSSVAQNTVKSIVDATENVKAVESTIETKIAELEALHADCNDEQKAKEIKETIRTENKRKKYVSQFIATIESDKKAASANFQMQKEKQLDLVDICGDMYSLEKLAFLFAQKSFTYRIDKGMSTVTNVIVPFQYIEEKQVYDFTVREFREFYSDVKVAAWKQARPDMDSVELANKREKTNRQSQMILSLLCKLGAFKVISPALKLSNDGCKVTLAENSKLLSLLAGKFEAIEAFTASDN